jgi:dimethylglycine dehydrogenase
VLAEWVTQGRTEWDMWSCDPRRYTDTRTSLLRAKGMETYGHEYAIHFPRHAWPRAAPKVSAVRLTQSRSARSSARLTAGSGRSGTPAR